MNVTANADTLEKAVALAYEGVSRVSWKDMYYRRDIGAAALARINSAGRAE